MACAVEITQYPHDASRTVGYADGSLNVQEFNKERPVFDQRMFANMGRSGFGIGISKSKLAQAMLEILIQLPTGTKQLKDTIIAHLGLLGMMSTTRNLNAAWNEAKKKADREYPQKFILDDRNVLHWNTGSVKILDKKISSANFRKLNELAEAEGCTVNQLVSELIRNHKQGLTAS